MSKSDLTTGQVVETPAKPAYVRPVREVKIYKGEPPQDKDGKTPQEFTVQEKCGIKDRERNGLGKEYTCQQKLHVIRQKNQVFVKDESGFGGQLGYDDKDIHQYLRCPVHGPWPAGPEKWEPRSDFVV
jgi:hypothetical protein